MDDVPPTVKKGYNMSERDERPDWTKDQKKVVWNRLKLMRDANRKVAEEADMLMQAIEAAPELDLSMQVAFGISNQPQPGGRVIPPQ